MGRGFGRRERIAKRRLKDAKSKFFNLCHNVAASQPHTQERTTKFPLLLLKPPGVHGFSSHVQKNNGLVWEPASGIKYDSDQVGTEAAGAQAKTKKGQSVLEGVQWQSRAGTFRLE